MSNDQMTPEAIANEALSAAGVDFVIGTLEEGSRPAQEVLRKYTTCVRQLLRSAHWTWARKQAFLQLVADASGNTPNVGTRVPGPFLYSYNMPTDCLKVRYIPLNYAAADNPPIPPDNIVPPDSGAPLMNGLMPALIGRPIVPTRFLVGTSVDYVPENASNNIAGISPVGMTVIMSNQPNAQCVYTFDAVWVNLWDELFRSAMVAFLASEIALPLTRDKKSGQSFRANNIAVCKEKISLARATNGNETWASSDLSVDWIRNRMVGGFSSGYGWGYGTGPGYLFGGYDGIFFENSSAY